MAGHAGDTETVLDALDHPQPDARKAALGAAQRLGIIDPERLDPFFHDPDPGVRYRAVEIAATLRPATRIVERLLAALEDSELAEVSAFALGELEHAPDEKVRVVAALSSQALDHADALCRESAVAALGALGEGLETILRATEDIATVRRRAVLALAPFEGPEVETALESALKDRDWQVRQAAEDLVGYPDPDPDSDPGSDPE